MDREGLRWAALGVAMILAFITAASLLGLALANLVPLFLLPLLTAAAPAGLVLLASGFGLVLWGTVAFGIYGHGTPLPQIPPKRLVTQGPYRHIRNPIYLGWFLGWGGLSLLTANLTYGGLGVVFLLAGTAYARLGERAAMAGKFGPEFERWARETPAFLPRWRR
ncbi:MAG TPA: isoprenylcysteine carboxylmethyltransferase family protein [Thermoplasmata archaeon]|nr:isoprenylcysteine carboxylmethyltransferase family protein [Thermoplasmata archaeon]